MISIYRTDRGEPIPTDLNHAEVIVLMDGPTFEALRAAVEVAFDGDVPPEFETRASTIWDAFAAGQP